ncbi:MAG: sigma-70 family RNA polymerase sigma factor [Deltaproteobacteria bacterium]|nr:sigma-70 family RNA polymerase sigma factor [Deltaproteobacteria bacterium]
MSQPLTHIPNDHATDEVLANKSLHDEDAFYLLMKRYEPLLLRYIHRMTQVNREEAEDLLQDIFIKVYRNLNGFDINLKFSTWVYRIAHNEIISQYRKTRRDRLTFELDDERNETSSLVNFLSGTLNLEAEYLNREKSTEVATALSELAPKYREILVLRYFEELSYEEISDILRKPPGSVATLLNRAREKFKKIAERYQLDRI